MTPLRLAALGTAVAAAVVLPCLGFGAVSLFAGSGKPSLAACGSPQPTGSGPQVTVAANVRVDGFTAEQVGNAAVIVQVGRGMGIPARGWVVAVATAMQESRLHNLGHLGDRNDHDSQGLFQQRPSQGWGTVTQIRDPRYAAGKFYERLVKVPGWLSLPLTVAAQKVQRSAFPSAYAKHEPRAARLVAALTGGTAAGPAVTFEAQPLACAAGADPAAVPIPVSGWVRPVPGGVVSKFGPRGGRLHAGVDLAAPKRTVVRAATAGTVIKAVCDASTARSRGCDVDGSPSTPGCGWYVDLAHVDGVMTRYCHLISRPMVTAGDQVAAGQQLGLSGNSGHSSGPHLHFEVHINGDRSKDGAVDPDSWMRRHGAPLGGSA